MAKIDLVNRKERGRTMICKYCGATLPEDVLFCTECGEKLPEQSENGSTDKAKEEYPRGSYSSQSVSAGGRYEGGLGQTTGSYNGQPVPPNGRYEGGLGQTTGSYNSRTVPPPSGRYDQPMGNPSGSYSNPPIQSARPDQGRMQPQYGQGQGFGQQPIPNYPSPNPLYPQKKKKSNTTVLLVIILVVVVVLGGGVWAFFQFGGGFDIFNKKAKQEKKAQVSIEKSDTDPSNMSKDGEDNESRQVKKDVKQKKEEKEEQEQEKQEQEKEEDKQKDDENLLSPKEISTTEAGDFMEFLWYLDGVHYSGIPVDAEFITDKDSLEGGWKCLIWYDPEMKMDSYSHQFLNVDITFKKERVEAVLDWSHSYFDTTEFVDESDMQSSKFSGKWEDGSFWASGPGTLHLDSFYRLKNGTGSQYAVGVFDSPDGVPAVIAMMRP